MKKTLTMFLISFLFILCFASSKISLAADAPSTNTLENLLKTSKVDYTKDPEGFFKIYVNIEGETTKVIAEEKKIDDSTFLVYIYTNILELPGDFKIPPSMLKKMAELNNNLLVGKVSLESPYIFYISSFWLSTATPSILTDELYFAHYSRGNLKKELTPFLTEQ